MCAEFYNGIRKPSKEYADGRMVYQRLPQGVARKFKESDRRLIEASILAGGFRAPDEMASLAANQIGEGRRKAFLTVDVLTASPPVLVG